VYGSTDTLGIEDRSAEFVSDILPQGKPVVLNFWGGSCPPCRAEMPDFQAALIEFGENAIFLGLDVGPFTGSWHEIRGAIAAPGSGYHLPHGVPGWRSHT